MSEERYETVNLIIKQPSDGTLWFDKIEELVSTDCQGSETEPCTCGLISMGGMGGTLDQCFDHGTTVGMDLQPIDLAKAIVGLHAGLRDEHILKVLRWAEKEIEFEDSFETKEDEDE